MIQLPIFTYVRKVPGNENREKIPGYHGDSFGETPESWKKYPTRMINAELGRYKVRFPMWSRMTHFRKKVVYHPEKYSAYHQNSIVPSVHLGRRLNSIKSFLVECGESGAFDILREIDAYHLKNFLKMKLKKAVHVMSGIYTLLA